MKDLTELTVIGAKISTSYDALAAAVKSLGLTEDELRAFQEYLQEQDTVMPLTDPTRYRDMGSAAIVQAGKRVEVLLDALPLLPPVMDGRRGP